MRSPLPSQGTPAPPGPPCSDLVRSRTHHLKKSLFSASSGILSRGSNINDLIRHATFLRGLFAGRNVSGVGVTVKWRRGIKIYIMG